ncbi:MAG: hypothetical protein JSU08_00105 [Acidobacteria bacterium]|nr:hypothetical protein [Acidobacteriota bacterium]
MAAPRLRHASAFYGRLLMLDERDKQREAEGEERVSPPCEVCGYGGPLRLVTEGASDDRWECPACAAHTLSQHRESRGAEPGTEGGEPGPSRRTERRARQ